MSATMDRRSDTQPGRGDVADARAVVAQAAQRRDPLRRRWGRVGGGVLAAVVGGWLFASLYLSADDRTDVLAVADGVERSAVVERADLRVVRLSTDTEVESIPASRIDEVVGRVAATDLAAGSLLAESHLHARGERLVAVDEAVVGLLVGPGDAPTSGLAPGAEVLVVIRPPPGATGDVVEVAGWVAEVSTAAAAGGDRPVSVVVPSEQAATVSAAAADRQVSIVVMGG